MKVKLVVLSILIFTASIAFARGGADSLSVIDKDSVFTFNPNVDAEGFYIEPADVLYEGMRPLTPTLAIDSPTYYIEKARAAIQKIRELNNFITNLDEASKFELPVGISRTIGGVTYDLAIDAIRLKPAYAELDVFLQFEVPQNGMLLTFMAKNIKLTNKGGIVGDATLELVGDYAINMNGNRSQIVLKGSQSNGNTFVTIDCDGFKELGIDAEVKFSRDLIRPEKPDGTQAEGHVTASFSTVMTSWNDLIVQLTLPTFQVNSLPGVSFSVEEAVFDFSDLRNAPNVNFPEGYQTAQTLPDDANLWRGFYLRELTVKLPSEFKKRGTTERTTLRASNLIIDNMGVTGRFTGEELITLQQGDMNGWAFSLNSLSVEIEANQLTEAKFDGNLVIPIGSEERPFEYGAIINTGGSYVFNVSPAQDMSFPLWRAGKVEIYDASYLEIRIQDHKFVPKANLHGRMTVNAKLSEGGQGVELADITFENLELQTIKPYIKVGNFSFGSEALQQKMAGFPISIQDIGMRSLSDSKVGLDFTLKLNLVGENSGSFAADAGLTVVGSMDSERGWQSWRYEDIQVHEIGVDIDGGAFKFNGRLIFYRNDVAYGDGFNGTVKAEFKPGIKLSAGAIFGNVKGMRYWYVDAMVNLPSGTPIFTGVAIYGFGGGAYYRMKMDNSGNPSPLGKTSSGVSYIPDEKAGLGLKAIVSIGSYPKPEAFNGDVTFEISFFQGGGVRYIAFGGNGYLVTPGLDVNLDKIKAATGKMVTKVKNLNAAVSGSTKGLLSGDGSGNSLQDIFGEIGENAGKKGSISAHVNISYDFENRVLHGDFEMFINVAGGIIRGVGAGGRAGWAVLHFAPQEWYIYVGTPDDRIGLSVGVGPIRVEATSYFMVGTKILGSPPPPENVVRILGGGDYDYMKDLNSLGTGAGFAFGAALSFTTGDLTFLMFYARFDAGLGFDIMLKNYGDTRCKGESDRIGVNGWYANGQAYAYFEGAIGIKVKVFGIRRDIEILSIGAAALLQAQLPNPFWMQGTVGGYFSVLNGLVKGKCKFQVTIGEKCELQERETSVVEDLNVIAQITPASDEKNVDVFNNPQIVCNFPIGKSFTLTDTDDQLKTFRIKLEYLRLMNGPQSIEGTLDWNDGLDVVAFNSTDILPGKKDLNVQVQISFEELYFGSWRPVLLNGVKVVETRESMFQTGEAPDFIPPNNVAYSYPEVNQVNYYKGEFAGGYIKLKKGQDYLFQLGQEWNQQARFTTPSGQQVSSNISYSGNEVSFNMPSGLANNTLYFFELVNVPAQAKGAVDKNVSTKTVSVGDNDGINVELSKKQAQGTISALQEKTIYESHFRTSQYATIREKLNAMQYGVGWRSYIRLGVHQLGSTFTGSEMFSLTEISGSDAYSPLVQFEAIWPGNTYLENVVQPLIYEGYPLDGVARITWRTPEVKGVPPARNTIHIRQYPGNKALSETEINANAISFGTDQASLIYDLPHYMEKDFRDIQSVIVNRYITTGTQNARLKALLDNDFPIIHDGTYRFKVLYKLPGKEIVTSTNEMQIVNPVKP